MKEEDWVQIGPWGKEAHCGGLGAPAMSFCMTLTCLLLSSLCGWFLCL
jgi:hypothetical protein